MNKERLLTVLVILLVLINVASLFFMFRGPRPGPPGPENEGMKDQRFQEHLQFDDEQMKVFRASKKQIEAQMPSLHHQLNKVSKEYYLLDDSNQVKAVKDSLLTMIHSIHDNIYKLNSKHFDDLRKVCRPDQLKQLHEFIDNLIDRPGSKGPPRQAMPNKK